MDEASERNEHKAHREFFRDILEDIHQIMQTEYHLTNVSVKPVGAEVARLSIPIKIEGTDKKREPGPILRAKSWAGPTT